MAGERTRLTVERRYELIPQMKDYVRLSLHWVPHVMYHYPPLFRSTACNTDEHGFRVTLKNGTQLDYAKLDQAPGTKGILCGGSTAFGIGATNDNNTIASWLNRQGETTWFNFGTGGYNSTQELLQFLLYLPRVDQVAIFSGINNLAIHALSPYFSDVYGSIFGQGAFQRLNHVKSLPQEAIDLVGRLSLAVMRRLFRIIPGPFGRPNEPDLPDFETRYSESLRILERDLDVWAAVRDRMGFSLLYVLQPIIFWMPKALTNEEKELVKIYDASAIGWGGGWAQLRRDLAACYPRYQKDTKRLCEERGIQWTDCNEALPQDEWLFCDFAHLTDRGHELAAEVIESACRLGV